jgi:hypothetical protein
MVRAASVPEGAFRVTLMAFLSLLALVTVPAEAGTGGSEQIQRDVP